MSGQKTTRTIGSLQYDAGTKQTIEIDRDGVVLETVLNLEFTVTSGSGAIVGPLAQTLARLIKNIEMTYNGSDTFINIPGWQLALMRYHELRGNPVLGMQSDVVLTGSTTATTYRVVLKIPHFLPRARVPDDCANDLRDGRQCTLSILWGTIGDLFGTPGSGAAISNVSCVVGATYWVNAPAGKPFLLRTLNVTTDTITATDPNFQMRVSKTAPGQGLRNLMITTTRNDVLVDDILSTIKLESGSFTWQNNADEVFQADMVEGLEIPPGNLVTGAYWLSPLIFAQLVTSINLGELVADLDLQLGITSTSGTERVHVLRESVRRPFI